MQATFTRSGADRGQDRSISIDSGLNLRRNGSLQKRLLNTAEALVVLSPEEKQNVENAPTSIFWKITVQRVTSSIHFTFLQKGRLCTRTQFGTVL